MKVQTLTITILLCIAPSTSKSVAAKEERPQMLQARRIVDTLESATAMDSLHIKNALVRGRVFTTTDTIRARLLFNNVRFLSPVAFDGAVLSNTVVFENCEFRNGISFFETNFEQSAIFRHCNFAQHTNFKKSLLNNADFEQSHFSGPSTFVDTRFTGPISFKHAQFDDIYFDRAKFTSAVNFTDAYVKLGASFKQVAFKDAIFEGTRFGEEAIFHNCRFSGPARFDRARFRRRALFNRADFADHASFRDITFVRGSVFAEARFAEGASFANSRFRSDLDLSGVTVSSPLSLNATFAGDLILHEASLSTLDLFEYSVEKEKNYSASASAPRVFFEGAHFESLRLSWENVRDRIAARDSTDVASLSEVYAVIAHHFRKQGRDHLADEVLSEWKDRQRTRLSWTSPHRLLLEFFNISSRYGNSLGRTLITGGVILLLFTLLYRLILNRETTSSDSYNNTTIATCFLISVTTFAHLGTSSTWCTNRGFRILLLAEGLIGWFYWAGLVAVSLRLLLRGIT